MTTKNKVIVQSCMYEVLQNTSEVAIDKLFADSFVLTTCNRGTSLTSRGWKQLVQVTHTKYTDVHFTTSGKGLE